MSIALSLYIFYVEAGLVTLSSGAGDFITLSSGVGDFTPARIWKTDI